MFFLDSAGFIIHTLLILILNVLAVLRRRFLGTEQRLDLIRRGVFFGACFGAVTGSIGALGVVHPETHGFWQVFLSGLCGKTWAALARYNLQLAADDENLPYLMRFRTLPPSDLAAWNREE